MIKTLIISAASAAALVPAAIGLSGNPSLSARTPVPAIEVPVAATSATSATHDANDDKGGQRARHTVRVKVTDGAHRNRHSGDDDGVKATRTATDDKGGTRTRKSSDDGVNHDKGDDKGGTRTTKSSDDGANHDKDDDKGGKHGGHGSDD